MTTDFSFEQIVQDHQAMVFRALTRLIGTHGDVQDLAQEVFLRLYRALPSFRGEALVSTYLYRIVVNVAQDEWKRRKRLDQPLVSIADEDEKWEDRLQDPGQNPEQTLAEREFQIVVEDQLGRLSAIERSILVLYHQEDLSYEQIAHSLKMPIGTVRTHLHRGRNKLREGIQTQQKVKRQSCQISR